jgi:hypothetical protein
MVLVKRGEYNCKNLIKTKNNKNFKVFRFSLIFTWNKAIFKFIKT